jgi:hypothetical protein
MIVSLKTKRRTDGLLVGPIVFCMLDLSFTILLSGRVRHIIGLSISFL